jgi:hypothetical protein
MDKESVLFTEQMVSFRSIVPDGFGTCDSAVVVPHEKTLHVFDLKYGKGVLVEAEENSQGMLYAIGLYNKIHKEYPCTRFVIHICQPRRNHWDKYEISFDGLKAFSLFVKEQAKIALSTTAVKVAGEKQCQWCLAKKDCETRQEYLEANGRKTSKKINVFDIFEDISNEID